MSGNIFKIILRLRRDCGGVTALEYALLTALMAVAILTGANVLGSRANDTFSNAAGKFQAASASSSSAAGGLAGAAPAPSVAPPIGGMATPTASRSSAAALTNN